MFVNVHLRSSPTVDLPFFTLNLRADYCLPGRGQHESTCESRQRRASTLLRVACVGVCTHPGVRCGVLPAGSVAILELRQARIQLLPQQQTVSTGPWPTTTIHTPVAYQPLGVLPSSASTSGGLSRRSGCLV